MIFFLHPFTFLKNSKGFLIPDLIQGFFKSSLWFLTMVSGIVGLKSSLAIYIVFFRGSHKVVKQYIATISLSFEIMQYFPQKKSSSHEIKVTSYEIKITHRPYLITLCKHYRDLDSEVTVSATASTNFEESLFEKIPSALVFERI